MRITYLIIVIIININVLPLILSGVVDVHYQIISPKQYIWCTKDNDQRIAQ